MQATLDASALKPFTKALACIARYGEELTIHAAPETLDLSTTNSSKSAYTRFKYDRTFFQRYSLEQLSDDEGVTGQLLVKSLLSILRHRAVDKTVERCDLSIQDGGSDDDQNDDGLESKLVVVLHCKHGVIKTHRLLLSTPTSLMSPGAPDTATESLLTVGPRAVKDMVEHFPLASRNKADSQLVWNFGENEVEVKTLESSIDSKGKSELATALSISAEEFEVYNLYAAPTVIAFHLGEFNATIQFTDAMSVTMDLRFTDPAAPLFIDVEGDGFQALFVISTSQTHTGTTTAPQVILNNNNNKKRPREETHGDAHDSQLEGASTRETPRFKRPMKAVQQTPLPSASLPVTPLRSRRQTSTMPAPSLPLPPPAPAPASPPQPHPQSSQAPRPPRKEPLFYPSGSQASQHSLHDLGMEDVTAEDVQMMLDDDDLLDDDDDNAIDQMVFEEERMTIEATQAGYIDDSKTFHPLFDD